MIRIFIICISMLIAAINIYVAPQTITAESLASQVRERLRNRVEASGFPPAIAIGSERVHSSVMFPVFYERRAYMPAWFNDEGLRSEINDLIRLIRNAEQEGLRPEDYHLFIIDTRVRDIRLKPHFSISSLVDMELLLTDAFLLYGSHLLSGKVNPETIDPEWHANRREADMAGLLESALSSGEIEKTIRQLLPRHTGYDALKQYLAGYKKIAARGGWPEVPDGPNIKKGDRGERVKALRVRLAATGGMNSLSDDEYLFGEHLEQLVRGFQRIHGLKEDGIVGPSTLAALNISAADRAQQIELNLERWRWLPNDLGELYILVNIANYRLDVIEELQTVMSMHIIVGRDYRRTPVFTGKMTYLVLSPYWHIPARLAIQDKLPLIRKDPDYLSKHNIRVFHGWGVESKEIDPKTIDWSKISAKNFIYRLRQEPGLLNAMGRVKFMFPNKFNVYLHDTPSRELFLKTVRMFSSGCIRIEKPIELAEYLLYPEWTRKDILAAIEKNVEKTVQIKKPLPVYLLYWTAWADTEGSIQFRNDIYGRDKRLLEALYEMPPRM